MPGRHSGDQVHKVKKTAAPLFYISLLQAVAAAVIAWEADVAISTCSEKIKSNAASFVAKAHIAKQEWSKQLVDDADKTLSQRAWGGCNGSMHFVAARLPVGVPLILLTEPAAGSLDCGRARWFGDGDDDQREGLVVVVNPANGTLHAREARFGNTKPVQLRSAIVFTCVNNNHYEGLRPEKSSCAKCWDRKNAEAKEGKKSQAAVHAAAVKSKKAKRERDKTQLSTNVKHGDRDLGQRHANPPHIVVPAADPAAATPNNVAAAVFLAVAAAGLIAKPAAPVVDAKPAAPVVDYTTEVNAAAAAAFASVAADAAKQGWKDVNPGAGACQMHLFTFCFVAGSSNTPAEANDMRQALVTWVVDNWNSETTPGGLTYGTLALTNDECAANNVTDPSSWARHMRNATTHGDAACHAAACAVFDANIVLLDGNEASLPLHAMSKGMGFDDGRPRTAHGVFSGGGLVRGVQVAGHYDNFCGVDGAYDPNEGGKTLADWFGSSPSSASPGRFASPTPSPAGSPLRLDSSPAGPGRWGSPTWSPASSPLRPDNSPLRSKATPFLSPSPGSSHKARRVLVDFLQPKPVAPHMNSNVDPDPSWFLDQGTRKDSLWRYCRRMDPDRHPAYADPDLFFNPKALPNVQCTMPSCRSKMTK